MLLWSSLAAFAVLVTLCFTRFPFHDSTGCNIDAPVEVGSLFFENMVFHLDENTIGETCAIMEREAR